MKRRSMLPLFSLALLFGAAGCTGVDGFYEKEYVLHDGTQSGSGAAAAEPADARTPAEAASADARTEIAAGVDSDTARDLERVFVLENLHDELGRAIRDGVGDLEALELKQQDVARELAWRRSTVGEAYAEARRARLEQLRNFPITVK
jgi:hypothetical protein